MPSILAFLSWSLTLNKIIREKERHERMKENLQRVQFRINLSEEKMEEMRRQQEEIERERQKRLMVLEKIAAQVPYADKIASIVADPFKMTTSLAVSIVSGFDSSVFIY